MGYFLSQALVGFVGFDVEFWLAGATRGWRLFVINQVEFRLLKQVIFIIYLFPICLK